MTGARKLIRDRSGDLQIGVLVHEVFDTAWRDLEPALEAQPQSTVEGARVLLEQIPLDLDQVR